MKKCIECNKEKASKAFRIIEDNIINYVDTCNICSSNGTKRCSKCKKVRKFEFFTVNKYMADSHASWCKICIRLKMKKMRIKDLYTPEKKYELLLKNEPTTDIDFATFSKIVKKRCFYCGKKNETLGLDQKIPKVYGGRYVINNVISCCWICNKMKFTRTQEQFFNYIKKIYEKHKLNSL